MIDPTRLVPVVLLLCACGGDGGGSPREHGGDPSLDAGIDAPEGEADAAPDFDAAAGDAAVEEPWPPGLDPDTEADLQEALERGLEESGSYSVIAGVAIEGEGRWVGVAGEDEGLERGALFRIGSITKMFVAVLGLLAVRDGTLSLDDTLDRWFPTVDNADAITLRQLLQHTSGIFNYTASTTWFAGVVEDPHRVMTMDDLLGTIAAEEPTFAPGADWSYSNSGFYLMGAILEQESDASLTDLLHGRIWGPLAMDATFYEPGEDTPALVPGWSPAFTGFVDPMAEGYDPSLTGPAGGVVSTADDMLDFLGVLAADDGALLTAEENALMHDTVDAGDDVGYGLGLMEFPYPGTPIWGHEGSIWGYHSILTHFPDDGVDLVLLVNRDGADLNAVALAILDALGI